MKRRKQKFLRLGYTQYSKLGLRRKKMQKYRRANGIDNKVRLRMKGHLRNVSIGFRNEKSKRDLIKGLVPVKVNNLEELKKVSKHEIAIIGSIGNKKKVELMEYAVKNNIKVSNINPKKFLEKIRETLERKKEEKSKKQERKKGKEFEKKEEEKKENIDKKENLNGGEKNEPKK
ncbi:hypothetical protein J4218_03880 [Candidatus Pacearchaeota archaeon]|nr:hypothetical protein [Candidatus Pacearchaeota archaeon]